MRVSTPVPGQDLMFVLEKVDATNRSDWSSFIDKLPDIDANGKKNVGASYEIKPGLPGTRPTALQTAWKGFKNALEAQNTDLYVAYFTALKTPVEKGDMAKFLNIDLCVTLSAPLGTIDAKNFPLTTHMGIFRNPLQRLGQNTDPQAYDAKFIDIWAPVLSKQKGSPKSAKDFWAGHASKKSAMLLHEFAACAYRSIAPPSIVSRLPEFMVTVPIDTMADELQESGANVPCAAVGTPGAESARIVYEKVNSGMDLSLKIKKKDGSTVSVVAQNKDQGFLYDMILNPRLNVDGRLKTVFIDLNQLCSNASKMEFHKDS